ncbi:glutamyl-tRNA synthetase [Mesomycoplasma conjunctivae]|nr:glutamyl-tRNA synthetase [Mesomycoplasma conjunctivae]
MNVKFQSSIFFEGKEQVIINFSAPIKVFDDEIFGQNCKVFECLNPENQEMIRLEFKNDEVTIFSGSSTLFFKKNTKIKNHYQNQSGSFFINTLLTKMLYQPDLVILEYQLLLLDDTLISDYKVQMEIS